MVTAVDMAHRGNEFDFVGSLDLNRQNTTEWHRSASHQLTLEQMACTVLRTGARLPMRGAASSLRWSRERGSGGSSPRGAGSSLRWSRERGSGGGMKRSLRRHPETPAAPAEPCGAARTASPGRGLDHALSESGCVRGPGSERNESVGCSRCCWCEPGGARPLVGRAPTGAWQGLR
jgi:hypothetical protein